MAREARQSRPQLVCVLADDSRSMAGQKSQAATLGIQEMLMECQAKGPPGNRSYFAFTLIRFDEDILLEHYEVPVRDIDPDTVHFEGSGGMTNITGALETLHSTLEDYMAGLQKHPERNEHPLPLVILFSDGYQNIGDSSTAVEAAAKIKALNIDGDHVMVVAAGVSIGGDKPDEQTLRAIAGRPNWYQHIDNVTGLSEFIAKVGSSGAASPAQLDADMEIFFGNDSLSPESPEPEDSVDLFGSGDHADLDGDDGMADLDFDDNAVTDSGSHQDLDESVNLADMEVPADRGSHQELDESIDLAEMEVPADRGSNQELDEGIDLEGMEVDFDSFTEGERNDASDGAFDLSDLEVGTDDPAESEKSDDLDAEFDFGDLERT